MRAGGAITILATVVAVLPPAFSASSVELYRRVVPLEATTGLVTVKESVSRELDVPDRCDDGLMHCTVLRRFAHIYTLDFEVETKRQDGDRTFVEREARGRIHLALATTHDEEANYDEILRKTIGNLGAAAFNRPFAGMTLNDPPFGNEVNIRTVEPSWVCFDNNGAKEAAQYTLTVEADEDGNERFYTGMSSYIGDEVTVPLCTELASATAAVYPEEIRTLSTPQVLLEQTFAVAVSDLLREKAYLDDLARLPEGAELSRRETPGVSSMHRSSIEDGVVSAARTREGIEVSGRVMAAELPQSAAGKNAWHSRWTMQTVERHLGPLPENRVLERWSLTASLIPVPPPRDLDDSRQAAGSWPEGPYEVRFDESALFSGVARAIDFESDLSPEALAARIAGNMAGLGPPGWILVICAPGGGATWGLPQAGAAAELLNGPLFCGAVESYLP